MEYKYDPETDILIIKLSKDKPDFGEQEGNIINHYNKEGKPIEIEILDASETVAHLVRVLNKAKKHWIVFINYKNNYILILFDSYMKEMDVNELFESMKKQREKRRKDLEKRAREVEELVSRVDCYVERTYGGNNSISYNHFDMNTLIGPGPNSGAFTGYASDLTIVVSNAPFERVLFRGWPPMSIEGGDKLTTYVFQGKKEYLERCFSAHKKR